MPNVNALPCPFKAEEILCHVGHPDTLRFRMAGWFSPKETQAPLWVWDAFALSIAVIPLRTSESLAAQIRLQWWWDALGLSEGGNADTASSPSNQYGAQEVELVKDVSFLLNDIKVLCEISRKVVEVMERRFEAPETADKCDQELQELHKKGRAMILEARGVTRAKVDKCANLPWSAKPKSSPLRMAASMAWARLRR